MKKSITLTLILLVGLLTSVSASGPRLPATDSIPADSFRLSMLPALLNDSIVGITLQQMDSLSFDFIDCDAIKEVAEVCGGSLKEAISKVEERDSIIFNFKQQNDLQAYDLKEKNWLIANMDNHIANLEKDLKKQRRRTTEAWITGAVLTGIFTGVFIATR